MRLSGFRAINAIKANGHSLAGGPLNLPGIVFHNLYDFTGKWLKHSDGKRRKENITGLTTSTLSFS